MKKIFTLFISIAFVSHTVVGQVHLFEDFQRANTSDPWIPSDWKVIDNDQKPIASAAGLNPAVTGSWQGGFGTQSDLGASVISSSAYDPAGSSSDDWLITPQISLPVAVSGKTSVLTFLDGYFAGNAPYNTASTSEVRISTTGNATADFVDVVSTTRTTIGTNFFLNQVDLSAYAGKDIYIAFRDISTNTYVYYIDNVNVETKYDDAIALNEIDIVDLAENGKNVTISGTIENTGVNNIDSYAVSWEDGTGSTITYNVTGVNIAPLFTETFEHTTSLVASNPGNFTNVTVTVSDPNGVVDQDSSDNSLDHSLFVNNGITVTRNVLVEEFSDAACGWCPDGAAAVTQLKEDYPDAIVVQHHGGYQFDDAMTIDGVIEEYEKFPLGGLPAVIMDRTIINPTGTARDVAWPDGVGEAQVIGAYVELDLYGKYDEISRNLDLSVKANFTDYVAPGDIRLTVYLVEDTLVNNPRLGIYDADWDQVNFIYQRPGWENHPYYSVGTPIQNVAYIDGYEHLDVVRDVWPSANAAGAWGDNSAITTTSPKPNDRFTKSMSIRIDQDWDQEKVSLVAFLSYYNSDDQIGGSVLNAGRVSLMNIDSLPKDTTQYCRAKFEAKKDTNSTSTFAYVLSNKSTNEISHKYSWSFGDGSVSSDRNPTHEYSSVGVYAICLTISDSVHNCISTYCDTLGTDSIGIIEYVKDTVEYCNAKFSVEKDTTTSFSYIITNNSSRRSSHKYSWDFGDGTTATGRTASHSYQSIGVYTICLTVSDSLYQCTSTYCDTLGTDSLLIINGLRDTINSDTTVIKDSSEYCVANYAIIKDTARTFSVILLNRSSKEPSHKYFWDFGDGNTATGRTPVHTYQQFGSYEVCLTVSDSIFNCDSTFCDSLGMDSLGNLKSGFTITVEDDFVGIEVDQSKEFDIKIYPNPTKSLINIDLRGLENTVDLRLLDLSGREVLERENVSTGNIEILNVDKLNQGVYFILIDLRNTQIIKKVIITD